MHKCLSRSSLANGPPLPWTCLKLYRINFLCFLLVMFIRIQRANDHNHSAESGDGRNSIQIFEVATQAPPFNLSEMVSCLDAHASKCTTCISFTVLRDFRKDVRV